MMRKEYYQTPRVLKSVSVRLERDFLTATNPEVQASGQEVKEYDIQSDAFNHSWEQGNISGPSGN